MQIDLCRAGAQMPEQARDPRNRHGAGPREPKNLVRRAQPGTPRTQRQQPRQEPFACWSARAWLDLGKYRRRLTRNAQGPHPIALPNGDDLARNRRVKVKMLVAVHMIERQAGLLVGAELGLDLSL